MPKTIRLLICDDHAVVRRGLRSLVGVKHEMELVGEAVDGEEAVAMAKKLKPDVIIMDLIMPRKDGVAAIAEIKKVNPVIQSVTERIARRSAQTRGEYLARTHAAASDGPSRSGLPCSNLAHGFAACGNAEKRALKGTAVPNIGIVSAYNDMLSAHQPFESYPAIIRNAAAERGAVAQFAGGVPAMCDGVTQGTDGICEFGS